MNGEKGMTKCIVADCTQETNNNALCPYHHKKLQATEREILSQASRRINSELRQFERLMYIEPPLDSDEIANRMVWPVKEVRWLLKKFKDDRK